MFNGAEARAIARTAFGEIICATLGNGATNQSCAEFNLLL
jgi:hypothetical protein